MTWEKSAADRYIGRDGSPVGKHKSHVARAAVFAAQSEVARVLGGTSPLTNAQMQDVLRAAVKAAPEIFTND